MTGNISFRDGLSCQRSQQLIRSFYFIFLQGTADRYFSRKELLSSALLIRTLLARIADQRFRCRRQLISLILQVLICATVIQ
jgi:hypothetical protein